jgi:hypothetical protein
MPRLALAVAVLACAASSSCTTRHAAPGGPAAAVALVVPPTVPIPAGTFRMGDLSEWVQDCRHDSYDGAPADGSAWEQGGDCGSRLVRGGTFVYGPPGLRSANRAWSEPGYRVWHQGFRVAEDR